MHVDIYRCDRQRCSEEKPAGYYSTDNSIPTLPGGWIGLSRGAEKAGSQETFCSLDCLAIWARQERRGLTSRTDVLE